MDALCIKIKGTTIFALKTPVKSINCVNFSINSLSSLGDKQKFRFDHVTLGDADNTCTRGESFDHRFRKISDTR